MVRTATIKENYRYELRRIWDAGHSLTVVGLNPSIADETKDDATIRVLVNYAKRLGFGSLTMLNLFAWRATRPADLIQAAASGQDVIGPDNDFIAIKTRIAQADSPYVFAAWGNHGMRRGREFIDFLGHDFCLHHLKCFAVNKDGSPHHPLRVHINGNISPYYEATWFSK